MKSNTLFFLLFLLIISSYGLQAHTNYDRMDHGIPYVIAAADRALIDVTHQGLHLTLDPRVNYISGRVETTFRAVSDHLQTITLDLNDEITIDSIRSESGTTLTFRRIEGHTFEVDLEFSLQTGQSATISIWYQGAPEASGLGSFVQTSHGTDSIIWTLSEPFGGRDWWPCSQNLTDKIDSLDLWITTPGNYRAASNGILVSESPTDQDRVIYHWSHRYPIATYLVAVAVTNYRVHKFDIELTNGPLPIVNYLYPQDYDRHSEQIQRILPGMMQLFEELFIPYPFDREKYGHAQCGFGGGMEHQTMSFMGGFSYSLTAHELAHQWFGDYITCGSWEDIWLNEGFASYLTGLTYQYILDDGQWESYLVNTITNVTRSPGGSVFVPDTSNVSRIFNSRLSYQKGGIVLHMLRWIVGDDHFFEGIRRYLLDERTQYAYVKTQHLLDHLEQVSGVDLDEFFRDWYTGQGFPSYDVSWYNTGSTLFMKVHQTTSHESVDFFELPVEFGLYGEGQDTLIRLDIVENGAEFEIPMPWPVDSIAVDPRHWIVSADNTTRVISSNQDSQAVDTYHIYPNPARDQVMIGNHSNHSIRTVQLYSVTGQLLRTINQSIAPGLTGSFEVGNRAPGLYFMVITGRNGSVSLRKLVISY